MRTLFTIVALFQCALVDYFVTHKFPSLVFVPLVAKLNGDVASALFVRYVATTLRSYLLADETVMHSVCHTSHK